MIIHKIFLISYQKHTTNYFLKVINLKMITKFDYRFIKNSFIEKKICKFLIYVKSFLKTPKLGLYQKVSFHRQKLVEPFPCKRILQWILPYQH